MGRKRVWAATVLTGAIIGALNLAHYAVTSRIPGLPAPLGIFPGGLPLGLSLGLLGRSLSPALAVMMVLGAGILLGASLSSWRAGELTLAKLRARSLPRRKAVEAGIGGLLMGIGVPMAGGCLVRHALSGVPALLASSWLALAGIVVGIWLAVIVGTRGAR